jgi:uncharacterized membrane protein YdjX (TVP38/TMEM64 family)
MVSRRALVYKSLTHASHSPRSLLPFFLGRRLFRRRLARLIRRRLKFWRAMNVALNSQESWKIMVLLRLSPIMPW